MRRLDIAGRGAELLDRKRQALLAQLVRVSAEAVDARRAWHDAVAKADLWSGRAMVLDGAGRLDVLARHVHEHASIELSWSNTMGARMPAIRELVVPAPPPLSALGASSAATIAADAWCEAARAAARHAVAERSSAELGAELARATRRLRALQKRWIPQYQAALAQLDLTIDENQREQAARVRWLTHRTEGPRAAETSRDAGASGPRGAAGA